MSSCLGLRRFIVCAISTMSARPAGVRCRPSSISSTQRANLVEVGSLCRPKWISSKERNDRLSELSTIGHDVLAQVLSVIVVSLVDVDTTDPEELSQVLEAENALHSLRHGESRSYLVSGPVADSARSAWLPNETDREATFSVYKTNHPTTKLGQSFLLIFRTRHVVTMVNALSDVYEVVRDPPGFPAYSQMRTAQLLTRGATNCLQRILSLLATIP
jgi:hypothetical protein